MKLAAISLMMLMWSPVTTQEPNDTETCATEPRGIGDATKCKRKCNSQCSSASNKSKCVAECRRACDR